MGQLHFHENQHMKLHDPSMHGSKDFRHVKNVMEGLMEKQAESNMSPQLFLNWGHKNTGTMVGHKTDIQTYKLISKEYMVCSVGYKKNL